MRKVHQRVLFRQLVRGIHRRIILIRVTRVIPDTLVHILGRVVAQGVRIYCESGYTQVVVVLAAEFLDQLLVELDDVEPAQRVADAFLVVDESVRETILEGVGGVFAH